MNISYRSLVAVVVVAGSGLFVYLVHASDHAVKKGNPADLVGTRACGLCHKKDDEGNQLAKWQAGPHAKAFATLGSDKAKEIAKAKGIADPQKDPSCLKCHSTAYFFTTEIKTDKIKVEEGVSCESCHGAGKRYMAKSVMEDRAKSIANGMIYPATLSCTACHNEESPTYKPFDEKEFSDKIAHPNPKKKK